MDCKTRIAKGASIPIRDIEAGLYGDDYFDTPHSKQPLDEVAQFYSSKN